MNTVIFKNDAVGDLVHSMIAINNITSSKKYSTVTVFLSKLSKKFAFLLKNSKVKVKLLNYNLNIFEKIKLILYLKKNKIDTVYILTPKNFYFYLPLIFRKIKFYAVCVNNVKNYRRPNTFLRKFLYKYEINDREKAFKRESAQIIQSRLTSSNNKIIIDEKPLYIRENTSNKLTNLLPENFVFFHYKKERFSGLNWSLYELQALFNEFNKYFTNIILTKDNEIDENNFLFKKNFNSYDFISDKFIDKKSNILFFDNIEGEDLFNVIKSSSKVIAFHGMMTNLAFLLKKPVLDLFYFKINSWHDYHKMRNSFYEFKPKYVGYDFIIPNKNIDKTIKKIQFSLRKNF